MIEEVKTLLGIKDNNQDEVLEILEKNTEGQLLALISQDVVPASLKFILTDVICARFNRLGNEGMQSYSQEGENITFPTSDFAQYANIIDRFMQDERHGKVTFFNEI